jgi:DNA-binding transcriptional ArsR family regulator
MSGDLDQRLRALANPIRRQILTLCSGEARAAGDLSSRVDLAPASVSEHLKTLLDADLVEVTRSGTWRFYCTNQVTLAKTLEELGADLSVGSARP